MAPPLSVVVADAEGETGPIGYLGLDAEGGEVLHLYVAPAWQGRGVGGRLLDAAKGAAAGPGGLALSCFRRNHAARAFYGRRGFHQIHCRDAAANEEGEPDVRLAWTPAPPDRTRGANA